MNLYILMYNQSNGFVFGGCVGFMATDTIQLKQLVMNQYPNWAEEKVEEAIRGCLQYELNNDYRYVPEMEFECLFEKPEEMTAMEKELASL